jgi:hypothetical protein
MASIIKADNIQKVSDGSNIIKKCGSTITLGSCGATIALACGATQTGFGRTGTVDWCTTAKTAPFTGVSGNGYFVNTTSGAVTVTLPATPSAGDIISLKDYANTWQTNNVTLANNSSKINGICGNADLNTEDQSVTLIYVDSTKGWRVVQDSTSSVSGSVYITATGGTIVTNGDFKTHIFTSDATFCVSAGAGPLAIAEYFVVAGGASGGTGRGGGGGAGGFRLYTTAPGSNSPLNHPSNSIPITVQSYPITVGAGGPAVPFPPAATGNSGSPSIFSTITSAGGGGGGSGPGGPTANDGGSGGGGAFNQPTDKGSGNTPPVSPPQGQDGGSGTPSGSSPPARFGGGGGGAGQTGQGSGVAGAGSFVADPLIGPTAPSYGTPGPTGSTRYFAGGGGGGVEASTGGTGGTGGGGAGGSTSNATAGTVNTGGGGGGVGENPGTSSGAGGSGIVMIRYKFQ